MVKQDKILWTDDAFACALCLKLCDQFLFSALRCSLPSVHITSSSKYFKVLSWIEVCVFVKAGTSGKLTVAQ